LTTLIGSAGAGVAAIVVWPGAAHKNKTVVISATLDLLRIISRLLTQSKDHWQPLRPRPEDQRDEGSFGAQTKPALLSESRSLLFFAFVKFENQKFIGA